MDAIEPSEIAGDAGGVGRPGTGEDKGEGEPRRNTYGLIARRPLITDEGNLPLHCRPIRR